MDAFVKRVIYNNRRVFLEKTLPKEGEILVKVPDQVRPFDVLGRTYISLFQKELRNPTGSRWLVSDGEAVTPGQVLSRRRSLFKTEETKAPFAGNVRIISGSKAVVCSPPERFNLVSGIEAKVVKVVDRRSVLLETEAVVVNGVWACGHESVGELKILDNGEDTLKTKDLGADEMGKVLIYFGFVPENVLQKAKTIGVAGVVCASIENSNRGNNFSVLVTEGFGAASMPSRLRKFFASLALRSAVISPPRRQLIIPGLEMPELPQEGSGDIISSISVGAYVQVLGWPYFAKEAEVVAVLEKQVFDSGIMAEAVMVKILKSSEVVKVPADNVLILD